MPQLNEVVDRGINLALARRLGLVGDVAVSLMPELAPTLALQSMPEMEYHMGWRKYMASGTVAAGVGNVATVQIRMPRNANILCIIEGFWLGITASEVIIAGIVGTTDLAVINGAQVRDTLQPASKPGVAIVSQTNVAPSGTGGGGIWQNQISNVPPIFPLILRPSLLPGTALDGFQFQGSVANTAADFCLIYRERILNDQENVV